MSSADEWLRHAEEESTQALSEAADLRTVVSTTRGSARSADGLVSAVVAPGGALVSLELDERVMDGTALQLQQSVVDIPGLPEPSDDDGEDQEDLFGRRS